MSLQEPQQETSNVIPFPVKKRRLRLLKMTCYVVIALALVADLGIGIYFITKLF